MKSPGLKSEKDFKEKAAQLELTEDQANAIWFYQDRARKAYEQREQRWEYFDNLTFYEDYIANRQAANTYLRPKKNDDEVRINTGTTEKKIEVVYNELLSLNLQPRCKAYDQDDNLMVDLSENWTDVVLRSNEIEKDDDIYQSAVLELLTQRAVFIEDVWEVKSTRDKRGDENKVKQRSRKQAKKYIRSGLKVFLGDIRLPWYRFNDQPYFILYDKINWKQAEAEFKYLEDGVTENPMWKYVAKSSPQFSQLNLQYGYCEDDEVEVLTYRSYPDDESMRLVNGIPMDKVGTKLPWEYEGYNMRQFGLKTMGLDFTYCKPLTASAKTLQSLDNESIRLVVRKWRQTLEPAMGSKKKITSKDIWSPATVVSGLEKDDLFLLNPGSKLEAGDFNILKFIESKTEEFIGAGNLQQGLTQGGKQTATEIKEQQRQFITQLGLAVLACMAMKRDMSELRTYTLLENATKPIDKVVDNLSGKVVDAYMKFTKEETDLGDGRFGMKRIAFMDRDLSPEEEQGLKAEEDRLATLGRDTRFFTINVKKLLEMPINWYWTVSQSMKDSEQLDKVMFEDSLKQAAAISQIAGRPLSGDAIIKDFEQTWKKKDYFQKEAPQSIMPPDMMGNPLMPGNPAQDLVPSRDNKPSLNTLMQ